MTGLNDLPTCDLEALSSYLDGALLAADAARLEQRLSSEASLRSALDDLRLTRRVLRLTPSVAVPRNFMLTAAQAGLRRRHSAQPAIRWAAALATVAFLAVSGLDLLMASPMQLGAAAPAAEDSALTQAFVLQTPEAEMVLESMAASEAPAEEPPAAALMAPAGTATAPAAERALPRETVVGEVGAVPDATGGGTLEEATPEAMLAAAPLPTPTPTMPPTAVAAPAAQPEPASSQGLGLLKWIEIVLGGAAAALILAALLLRRYA